MPFVKVPETGGAKRGHSKKVFSDLGDDRRQSLLVRFPLVLYYSEKAQRVLSTEHAAEFNFDHLRPLEFLSSFMQVTANG